MNLLVYDEDSTVLGGTKKDLLGRIWIEFEKKDKDLKSPVDGKFYRTHSHVKSDW